ncbi:site-specific integrase [uncultured Draconibacterium sp.]|uniref:site-specific integrase n=1 Tax=uncultured Draconibacterium sp. TaxID=1573823 RepID=UPI002AA8A654|nr:site-specific integrase [uncultured Draconibacterium sp.]
MIGVTTAIVLDKRIQKKDETYAVKLRITHNRYQKYYPINEFLTVEEWEKTNDNKSRGDYKKNRVYFNQIEKRAIDIIKELHPFSFPAFEKKFNQDSTKQLDALMLMQSYIDKLKEEKRFGSAQTYNDSLKSIKKFNATKRRRKILVWTITSEWLQEYEGWMKDKGRSVTTIGMYLRCLRTIVNIAIENGSLSKDEYPFGKRKYQIPTSRNVKKALTLTDIKKIFDYKPVDVYEERARDFWILSYLCNGINIKDIALLQNKNIQGNKLIFLRAKTENTSKSELKEISVPINDEIKSIIAKWGNESQDKDDYIFSFISKGDSPEKQFNKIKYAIKKINKFLKKIGETLELNLKLTTYTARHSYATVLKRSGAPIEFISESLGHKDLKTTENYLDSFEDEVKEAYQKKLLDF